jgi:hypothetical protein
LFNFLLYEEAHSLIYVKITAFISVYAAKLIYHTDKHLGTHAIARSLIFFGAEQHYNKNSFIEAVRDVKRSLRFVVYAQFVAYICIFHRIADLTL